MTESTQKKRKWDLDDSGQTRAESLSPASKFSKVSDDFSKKTAASKDIDPSRAASLAAAKINAMLAQKGISLAEDDRCERPREKDDAEFVKDIPINDLKNRYMLTRGATQTQIQRETGADVTTRGKYYPDKSLASDREPPLYLHVTASTKEALDKALAQIDELIETATVPLPGTGYPPREVERRGEREQRKFLEHKIYVGIEGSPHFNIRAKIVGPQGAYVKHIQNETGSRVQLKGRGSGFYETNTGVEAEEPLHVHISCARQEGLDQAVKLTQDLIDTVKQEHERASQQAYGRGPPANGGYSRNYRDYPGAANNYAYPSGYTAPMAGNPPLPTGPPPPPPPPSSSSSSSSEPPTTTLPGTASGSTGSVSGSAGTASVGALSAGAPPSGTPEGYGYGYTAEGGYDYSQYYAYYGQQYPYDASYYNYYGYTANAAPPPPTAVSPPPAQPDSPQSYNAVPPPPQL